MVVHGDRLLNLVTGFSTRDYSGPAAVRLHGSTLMFSVVCALQLRVFFEHNFVVKGNAH